MKKINMTDLVQFESLTTVSQRDYFVTDLELVIEHLYSSNKEDTFEVLVDKYISEKRAKELMTYMSSNDIKPEGPQEVEKKLSELIAALKKLDVLQIHSVVDFKEWEIRDLIKKTYNITGKRVLIDLILDTSLVGGAILGYKGKHRDFSLAVMIKNIFDKEREVAVTNMHG